MSEKVADSTDVFSWSTHSILDVYAELRSSPQGLDRQEVTQRQAEYGENALPQKPPTSAVRLFFHQLSNPLMAILLVAGLMSAFLGEWLDTSVILLAVLFNSLLGFVEEYKADKSLEAISAFLPMHARVRREGEVHTIDAKDIVPGDIVVLQTGDKITADGRLTMARSMEVNEAPLTGESEAVAKREETMTEVVSVSDQSNMVFAGTVLVAGRGEYVVTATGLSTQIGQISDLVSGVKDEATPLQRQLTIFARFLGAGILLLALLVYGIGIWRGFGAVEMFQVSVALAVSAVPEGLVIAMTVILAIGMQRILARKALVRKLVGAETLGSVSVICMDKTGTLTTGEMEIVRVEGDEQRVKEMFAVTHTAAQEGNDFVGSPTEVAMARFARDVKYAATVVEELPFDSSRKFKATRVMQGHEARLYVVGAPEILFDRLDMSDQQRRQWLERTQEMAREGLRVLLVCEREDVGGGALSIASVTDLTVVAAVGLEDPLRASAEETVQKARTAGLHPVMITGDHPETAFVIAQRVGLASRPEEVITGERLDEMSDDQLSGCIAQLSVFARVLPRHKLRLVRAWQEKGASVAMIGDGVNDAPAMKAADIGVALGSGTEVTKETADMVLLDNRFKTIVAAIREGRIMFDNIRKMIVYLLSDSFAEIILILAALLLSLPLPILPAQILWINLVTDGFSSIALTFEKGESGVMREPPRKKGEPLLNTEMKIIIFVIGIMTNLVLLAVYLYMIYNSVASLDHIRTFIFAALGMDSLLYVFAVRTFRSSIFASNPFANRYLVAATFVGFGLLLLPMVFPPLREAFAFTSLTLVEWGLVVGLGLLTLILIEIVKFFSMRIHKRVS